MLIDGGSRAAGVAYGTVDYAVGAGVRVEVGNAA